MNDVIFSQIELVEISDAISEVLGRLISNDDPEKHESQYGTLTLLHEAQAKLTPAAFGFALDQTSGGPERSAKIAEIRRKQGLPEYPTDTERARWTSSVTPR